MGFSESTQMGGRPQVHGTRIAIGGVIVSVALTLSSTAGAQTTAIGSGRPAIEVNEQAIFYGTPSYTGPVGTNPLMATNLLPLYDPRTGTLHSRVINLVPPPQIALQLIPPAAGRIPAPPDIGRSRVIDLPPPRGGIDYANLEPPPPPPVSRSGDRRLPPPPSTEDFTRLPDPPRVDPPMPAPPLPDLPDLSDSTIDTDPVIDLPPPVVEDTDVAAATPPAEPAPRVPPPPPAPSETSTLPPPVMEPEVMEPEVPAAPVAAEAEEPAADTEVALPPPPMADEEPELTTMPPPPVVEAPTETPATPPPPVVEDTADSMPSIPPPPIAAIESEAEDAVTGAVEDIPMPELELPEPDEVEVAAREPTAPLPPPAPSLPAPTAATDGATMVPFAPGEAELPADAASGLRTVAEQVIASDGSRIQLKAYAAGESNRPSAARRLSLSRALAVRSFLIEAGVRSTNIDVRALGSKYESGPADRVDVVVIN